MATTTRDPYNLSYAEDTQGQFGSGWRPGEGTAADRAAAAAVGRSQQQPTKVLKNSNGQTVGTVNAPAAAKAAPTSPNSTPVGVPAAVAPAPPGARATTSGQSPLNVLSTFAPPAGPNVSNISVAGATPAPLNTSLSSPGQVFPQPPTRAEKAGAAVRGALSATRGTVGAGVQSFVRGERSAESAIGRADEAAVSPFIEQARQIGGAVAGFGRGLLGRATQAGATNATAAQFQQPTAKSGGRPVTPTSPQFNIDRTDQSLGKFGLSDAEFSRRKLAFAGF